jgi:hypothetical protein
MTIFRFSVRLFRRWTPISSRRCDGPSSRKQKVNLMKLEPVHHPLEPTVTAHMDLEAQAALAQAGTILKDFFRDPQVRLLAAQGGKDPDLLPKMATAVQVLMELGRAESGRLILTIDDLENTLEVTIQVANFRVQRGLPVFSLPQSLVLLATATPCFIPHLPLPPAAEVLDRQTVPATTWAGYEGMRLWYHPCHPFLYLLDAYQIWRALKTEPPTHPGLQDLLRVTDTVTRMFRATMARLAAADRALPKKANKRRRRKP